MKKKGIFVILCALIIGCTYSSIIYLKFSEIKMERSIEDEECLVYQSLLQTIINENPPEPNSITEQLTKQIVINNMTNMDASITILLNVESKSRNNLLFTAGKVLPDKATNLIVNKIMNIEHDLPTLLPETLNSFKNANKTIQKINLTCCNINYKFISEDDRQAIINQVGTEEYWQVFRKKYPQGYLTISNIGFNTTREQALVHISFTHGGEIFLLSKEKERWKLKYRKRTWFE